MLLFSLGMGYMTAARENLDFQLEDTARSLETSQGRERKQQYEYEQAEAELPLVQAELAETEPLAAAAREAVTALKEERKTLRQLKKEKETRGAMEGAGSDPDAAGNESWPDTNPERKGEDGR